MAGIALLFTQLMFQLAGSLGTSMNQDPRPLVIAHRGASGVLPEHTVAAYRRAIEVGADYIECDVSLTKDLHPVCLHENWLAMTTDVADRSEFADRRRNLTLFYEGSNVTLNDWFAVDFTLEELKRLRKKQQFDFRDQSYNGKYPIATFEEYLSLGRDANRTVGIYPEVKDPEWLNSLDIMNGTRFEDIIIATLVKFGYTSKSDACFVQSFSEQSLIYLSTRTQLRLVMLIEYPVTSPTQFSDWKSKGFYAVGPWLDNITPFWNDRTGYKNWFNTTTDLVKLCHQNGLMVHAYTMRNEDRFLAWNFAQDINKAYEFYFKDVGVDGFFTDFPETLVRFRRNLEDSSTCQQSSASTLMVKPLETYLFHELHIVLYPVIVMALSIDRL